MDKTYTSTFSNTSWTYNDGGRKAAGYKGTAGDCVVRSVAIATGLPYKEVYDALSDQQKLFAETKRCKAAKRMQRTGRTSARTGVYRKVYQEYLESLGWVWVPLMQVGTGCTVHLRPDELPKGRIICRLSRHLAAAVDGIVHDTYDCTRNGTRCVYGYFYKP